MPVNFTRFLRRRQLPVGINVQESNTPELLTSIEITIFNCN